MIVLGNLDDFVKATNTPEIRRNTLLCQLLARRDPQYSAEKGRPPPVIEPGARVATETFGDGKIEAVETGGKAALVKFDDGRRKTILASFLKAPSFLEATE